MQEAPKNCFESNKLNTTLHQAKIGKQECHKITETKPDGIILQSGHQSSVRLTFSYIRTKCWKQHLYLAQSCTHEIYISMNVELILKLCMIPYDLFV